MRRAFSAIGGVLLLTFSAVGCGSKPVVGVLLPSSGPAANYGESIESGVRLAVADARNLDQLPVGFEVAWADSASDPEVVQRELRRLASDRGANLVIGGATSAEARAIIPLLDELNLVCISPSASAPDLAATSRQFFRIYPSDELEGYTAARFLIDRMGQQRVVLYVGDSEYADGIEPEFSSQFTDALGGEIVARIELDDGDWRDQSARALAEGVGAVYVIGYAEETLEVLRHLAEEGFGGRVLVTSAFYSSRVIREAGTLAEGILFPLPPFDRTSEKEPVLGFVMRYMDTYQRAPDVYAAHGYDAMRLAIEVMRIAQPPETENIRKALSFGVTEFMGVTGPILFDDYGDVKHYPKMFIVKDGDVISYQRYMKAERSRILREVQDLLTEE